MYVPIGGKYNGLADALNRNFRQGEQVNYLKSLAQFKNMPDRDIRGFLSLSPEMQKGILSRLAYNPEEEQTTSQSPLSALMQQQQPQVSAQQSKQQTTINPQALQQQTDALRMLKQYGASPEQIQSYMQQQFGYPQAQMQQPQGISQVPQKNIAQAQGFAPTQQVMATQRAAPKGYSLGLTPQEKLAQERQELSKQKAESQRQTAQSTHQLNIIKQNESFNKEMGATVEKGNVIGELAEDLWDLWKSGKVETGLSGAVKSGYLKIPYLGDISKKAILNPESAQFESKADELALEKLKGNPTGFKIRFAQGLKPSLSMDKMSQGRMIQKELKKNAKSNLLRRVANKIIDENGGNEPKNMRGIVSKEYEKALHKMKQLPDAFDIKDGATAFDEKTGYKFVTRKGVWQPDF